MHPLFRLTAKSRVLSSRLGSLLLLFQRSPVVQLIFPEARLLGGAGLGEITKWTVVGLGAYDSVSGATTITQLSPDADATTVPATAGSGLSFVLQRVSNPAGTVDSATVTISIITPPLIITAPASLIINRATTATLSVQATGTAPSYQWYFGVAGVTTAPVDGATFATSTTPALTATTRFWVRATNPADSAFLDAENEVAGFLLGFAAALLLIVAGEAGDLPRSGEEAGVEIEGGDA